MRIEIDLINKKILVEDENAYPRILEEVIEKLIRKYFPEQRVEK